MPTASHRFSMRLTIVEYEALTNCADNYGVSRSQVVRRLIRELVRQRPDYFGDEKIQLRDLFRGLSQAGTNLNQIARKLNTDNECDEAELEKVLADTRSQLKIIKTFIGAEIASSTRRTIKVMEAPEP